MWCRAATARGAPRGARGLHLFGLRGLELLERFEVAIPRGRIVRRPEEAAEAAADIVRRNPAAALQVTALAGDPLTLACAARPPARERSAPNDPPPAQQPSARDPLPEAGDEEARWPDPGDWAAGAADGLLGTFPSVGSRPVAVVNSVLVCEQPVVSEVKSLVIAMNPKGGGSTIFASPKPEVTLAHALEHPRDVVSVAVGILEGLTDEHVRQVVDALKVKDENLAAAARLVSSFYDAFIGSDALLVETGSLAEVSYHGDAGDEHLACLDVHVEIDDNAAFRQRDIFSANVSDNPIQAKADELGVWLVNMGGSVACLSNGAGTGMAMLDLVTAAGASPANLAVIPADADADAIAQSICLTTRSERVRSMFINVFGGLTDCEVVAQGIHLACQGPKWNRPVVARFAGEGAEKARQILAHVPFVELVDDIEEAATHAVSFTVRHVQEKPHVKIAAAA